MLGVFRTIEFEGNVIQGLIGISIDLYQGELAQLTGIDDFHLIGTIQGHAADLMIQRQDTVSRYREVNIGNCIVTGRSGFHQLVLMTANDLCIKGFIGNIGAKGQDTVIAGIEILHLDRSFFGHIIQCKCDILKYILVCHPVAAVKLG